MRLSVVVAAVFLSLIGLAVADDVRASIRKPTNIPAQALGSALQILAKDRNFQVVYVSEELNNLRTHGAVGEFTSEEALKALLAGTGMTFRYLDENTVTIVRVSSMSSSSDSAPAQPDTTPPASAPGDSQKEGKKGSSDTFRVAQVDQGQTSSGSTVEKEDHQASKKKPAQLEEVIVTGSRIPTVAGQGPQEVKIYQREQIEKSGQTTISDFLNTLPEVSVSNGEGPFQNQATTIQLRGLPIGTTLLLINGRRIEGESGKNATNGLFDLGNIPLAAVERIEIVPVGSSAIYGSDGIAGVVNIILRKNFDGLEANARYGFASGTDEIDSDLAWGKAWERGSISIVGNYQTRSELQGFDRSITANADFRRFGGPDSRSDECNPASVYSLNGTNLQGVSPPSTSIVNRCSLSGYSSELPATRRWGIFASGTFEISSQVQLFAEFLYSHADNKFGFAPPGFGFGQFGAFTVPVSNPFNPYGQDVGVSYLFTSVGRSLERDSNTFTRPLVGAKGSLFEKWNWEVAAWEGEDRERETQSNGLNFANVFTALDSTDPATALNLFTTGAPASAQVLNSLFQDSSAQLMARTRSINGFVRGPVFDPGSGPIEVVLGAESNHDRLEQNESGGVTATRVAVGVFGEARIPIIANREDPQAGDRVAATVSVRHDHYDDFGSTTNPQYGLEMRPTDTLLFRASYGKSFKAPTLFQLNEARSAPFGPYPVFDPVLGQTEFVSLTFGGNPTLLPETGRSRSFGVVYSSRNVPGLKVALTNWDIKLNNAIQVFGPQDVASNENLLPGGVVRASSCVGGPPCPITTVNFGYYNFGSLNVAGFDFEASYVIRTSLGDFTPSLNVTETYRYIGALLPALPPTNRAGIGSDDGDWAPHLKGTLALAWDVGPYAAHVDGRYVSSYQDYDSTRRIGNFWLLDANIRYHLGALFSRDDRYLNGTYLEAGAVNLFNNLPQYSNFSFGTAGYDASQADIRGRFLYAQVGTKW